MNDIIDVDPILLQLQQDALALQRRMALWENNKAALLPAVKALSGLGIEAKLDQHLDVNFTGDKEMLGKVYGILRKAGYSPNSRPDKPSHEWYSFWNNPHCQIVVWTHFTSTVCKRVQVGTKTVEQPIYEISCGTDIQDAIPEEPKALDYRSGSGHR